MDIYEKEAKSIKAALEKGDYEVQTLGPNNYAVKEHRDGSEYVVYYDESPTHGWYLGECTVYVAGYTFVNTFNDGEWEVSCDKEMDSDFVPEKLLENKDLMDAFGEREDIICGSYWGLDDELELINKLDGTAYEEWHWCDDPECNEDEEEEEITE